MNIIDFHVHIYPEKIAEKATQNVGLFYGVTMAHTAGTVPALLERGAKAGVTHYVAHGVATAPNQVVGVNDYLAAVKAQYDNIFMFGTLHPDMENSEGEINRIEAAGFKGVKLHPDCQNFALDDKKALTMLEPLQGRLPLLIHAGDVRYRNSNPKQIVRMLDALPGLTLIAAHLGGYSAWDDALEHLSGRDVYVDTSSTLPMLSPERAKRQIEAFSPDKILFGTDFPMWQAEDELAMLRQLVPDDAFLEKILWSNGKKLLGI